MRHTPASDGRDDDESDHFRAAFDLRRGGFLVPLVLRLRGGLFLPTSANGFGSTVFISILR
jgi:hypothetical protein